MGDELEIRGNLKKEVFSVWQPDALEMSGRLFSFPWLLKLRIRAAGWAGQGWAGPVGEGEGGGGGKGGPCGGLAPL